MFLRAITKQYPSGPVQYLYLLEGFRDGGRVRQRVVANLGRADRLAPHLDDLIRLLRPYLAHPVGRLDAVESPHALTYGPVAVARQLWDRVGLGAIVARHCGQDVAERAFVLVAHRLLHPGSEHALAWWLEESYVTDTQGRRWLPEWEARGRVRVCHRQLQRWYRTLDRLLAAKAAIEQDVYLHLRDLFGLQVDLVFYDLTSTYFEGTGPEELADYGRSRDGRPRNRQVLVGVVMASGWPIASYVFPGRQADKTTVQGVLADVRARFALQRVVWVADRGMVSDENLATMSQGEDRYLVGLQRRRNPTAQAALQAAVGPWQPLPEGGEVTEVHLPGDPTRYIVVRSPDRLGYEQAMRRQSMRRCRDALRELQQTVASGRLRAPEKIGARAGAILAEHHGHRYFAWRLEPDGQFRFWVDRAKLRAERRVEGTFLLQTNDPTLTPLQLVAAYKDLQTVERAFRALKDVLAMRPIYHQTPPRVRGHLFVAHLALLLGCALEKALRRAGLTLALDVALAALRPIRLVTLELEDQQARVLTKKLPPHAQAVLKAVGLARLPVPEGP
jgi:transposase